MSLAHYGTAILIGLGLAACGKKDASKDTSAAGTSTSTSTNTSPATTSSQAGIMVLNAINSAGAVGGAGLAADKAGKKAGVVSLLADAPTLCKGELPVNAADTVFNSAEQGLSERAPYYAAAYWYCMMTSDQGRTLKAALHLPVSVACALGDLKFDGSEKNVKATIPIATPCFLQADVDQMTQGGMTSIPISYTAGPHTSDNTDFFTQEVTFTIAAETMHSTEDMNLKLLYGISATGVNLGYSSVDSKGRGEASVASLDFKGNTIHFERIELVDWATTGGTGNYPRTQHTRLLAKGTFDTKGNFTTVSHLEGASTGIWAGFSGGSFTGASANLVTMKGDPASGIRTHSYHMSAQSDAAIPALSAVENFDACEFPGGPQDHCHPVTERISCFGDSGAVCSGNNGITFAANAEFNFFNFPSYTFTATPKFVTPTEFISGKAARLEFDQVLLSE